jgi:thymidylate kinase
MNQYMGSKLIIVEGLTGSGKSIMAHFIARQHQYNGISAQWVHEGEVPHPIFGDLDISIEKYMAEMRANWVAYVNQIGNNEEVHVVEACFFNNLLETLLAHNVERAQIIQYAAELQAIIQPLNPTLVYLVQEDVEAALERNFNHRGSDFRNHVIELATSTPLTKVRGWEGYDGMLLYWQEFVALTDELFQRFPSRKLKIDNTAGDWDAYNQQVLGYLALPLIPEQNISPTEALNLIGLYKDRQTGKEITVRLESGGLTINLFLNVWTRLVRRAQNVYLAEGWPFEISFESDNFSYALEMKIGGRNVDYLPLVGTVADRECVNAAP